MIRISLNAQRRHRNWLRIGVVALPASLSVAACVPQIARGPDARPAAAIASTRSLEGPAREWPGDRWWQAFGDPQLDGLIGEALQGAPDLAAAAARARRAAADALEAGAALRPAGEITAGAGAQRDSTNIGVDAAFRSLLPQGWKSSGVAGIAIEQALDFFGRNRAALAAATSEAEARRIELAAARIEIAAAVAEAYAEFARLGAEQQASADALRIRRETAGLVARRLEDGLENSGRLAQARAAESSAQVDLIAVDRALQRARHRIAALLGAGPDRGLTLVMPVAAQLQPVGVPADAGLALVGRRADLVAARLRTQAAAHRIDVERAGFYPDVRLRALVGLRSIPLGDLLQSDSQTGNVGPAVSLPLFRSSGAITAAAARYDEAVAEYDAALVRALRELADALVDQRELAQALQAARTALEGSERAYAVAQLRYKGGLTSYLDVLTVETDMLQQRRRVAVLEAQRMQTDVALLRALGGGFAAQPQSSDGQR